MHYVALDLEATGLDTDSDCIIEIGAVRFEGGDVIDRLRTFVNPQRPVPHAVQRLTGISDGDVAGAPPLYEAAAQLQAFLGDDPLVGHNILGFDALFLRRADIA